MVRPTVSGAACFLGPVSGGCSTLTVLNLIGEGVLIPMDEDLPSNFGREYQARASRLRSLGTVEVDLPWYQDLLNFYAPGMKVSYEEYKYTTVYEFEGSISFTSGEFPWMVRECGCFSYGDGNQLKSQPDPRGGGEFWATGYLVVTSTESTLGYSLPSPDSGDGADPTNSYGLSDSTSTLQITFVPTSFTLIAAPFTGTAFNSTPDFVWHVTG